MTPATKRGRIVVTYSCRASRHHESVTLRELASRLAAIKGCGFVGEYDPALRYSDPLYFVPNDTLVGIDAARRLGIKGEADLFAVSCPSHSPPRRRSPIHCPMPSRTHRRDGLRNSRIAFATWWFRVTRRLRGAMLASPGCDCSNWDAFA